MDGRGSQAGMRGASKPSVPTLAVSNFQRGACDFATSVLTCKQSHSTLPTRGAIMTTTQAKTGAPTVDAAFEQVKGLNEQWLGSARQAGTLYLDAYEKAVEQAIELELKVAGYTRQEWLKDLIQTQAEFMREVASSYTSTARSLLK
jgi:hypothetical protein